MPHWHLYKQHHGSRTIQAWFFHVSGHVLEALGHLFWVNRLSSVPADRPSDVEDLSDQTIIEAHTKTFDVITHPLPNYFRGIKALTPNTVMKRLDAGFDSVPPAELVVMQVVKGETSIPIPTIHRCARGSMNWSLTEDLYWFILTMERIDAVPLKICWDTLSWWERLRIVWILRQYVNQLRQVKNPHHDRPGPLGESLERKENGLIFDDTVETFSSSEHLARWFYDRATPRPRKQGNPKPPKLPFPDPTPLVLTHGDIHPGNVLLDKSGRVWLIDWECSGFYPRWFEYLTAVQVAYNVKAPASWRLLLPLITGPSFANEAWAQNMHVVYTPSEDWHDVGLDVLFFGIKKWLRSKVRGFR